MTKTIINCRKCGKPRELTEEEVTRFNERGAYYNRQLVAYICHDCSEYGLFADHLIWEKE
jgi:hypothetical protein